MSHLLVVTSQIVRSCFYPVQKAQWHRFGQRDKIYSLLHTCRWKISVLWSQYQATSQPYTNAALIQSVIFSWHQPSPNWIQRRALSTLSIFTMYDPLIYLRCISDAKEEGSPGKLYTLCQVTPPASCTCWLYFALFRRTPKTGESWEIWT